MFFYQVFINIKSLYFTIGNNPYFISYQLKGRPGVVRGKKIEKRRIEFLVYVTPRLPMIVHKQIQMENLYKYLVLFYR